MFRKMIVAGIALALDLAAPVQAQRLDGGRQLLINHAIQDALAWTGHYNGLADGAIGEKSIAAIAQFQRAEGWIPTGDLDAAQKLRLLQVADAARRRVGFQVVSDARSMLSIGLPTRLVTSRKDTTRGSTYRSADGQVEVILARFNSDEGDLRAVYQRVIASPSMTGINYRLLRSDAFFVAGFSATRDFYRSARMFGREVRGFAIAYPRDRAAELGPIIVAMVNSFKAPMIDYAAISDYIRADASAVAGYVQRVRPADQPPQPLLRVRHDVSEGILNLRAGPGTDFPIISAIPADTGGIVLPEPCATLPGASGWCKIRWLNLQGWASMTGLMHEAAPALREAPVSGPSASFRQSTSASSERPPATWSKSSGKVSTPMPSDVATHEIRPEPGSAFAVDHGYRCLEGSIDAIVDGLRLTAALGGQTSQNRAGSVEYGKGGRFGRRAGNRTRCFYGRRCGLRRDDLDVPAAAEAN